MKQLCKKNNLDFLDNNNTYRKSKNLFTLATYAYQGLSCTY